MAQGYDALREGAAWLDLSARGKIYVTGEDRARLLHSMTTNHVQQLTPGQGCYAFFLNAQGRILADVYILCQAERFLLDTEPETREFVYRHLDKYIIADDVALEDATERVATLAVEGPAAAAVMTALGAPVPATANAHSSWQAEQQAERAGVACVSFTGLPGYRIFVPAGGKLDCIARLERAGAAAADADAARIVRLENGTPRYGEDIFDTTLPQETQLAHALHFQKGCYLGQEIVERIRSRGHVNRLLAALTIESAEVPAKGTPILAEAVQVGEIASAAFSPALGKTAALGYVRASHAAPGTALTVEGHAAAVRPAPAARPAPGGGC
jgi:tRNA-modifying protein YgfZ